MTRSPPQVAVLRLVGLLGGSVVLASGNAWLNPHRPAWSREVLAEGEIGLAEALAAGDSAA